MLIAYTARRSLITGHVAGSEYSLTIDTTHCARARTTRKAMQKSLSGALETLYFGGENEWTIDFAPFAGTLSDALVEFLDSTESGESFAMTLYGDASSPRSVKRIDEGYQLQDFLQVQSPDRDYYTTSIRVVET